MKRVLFGLVFLLLINLSLAANITSNVSQIFPQDIILSDGLQKLTHDVFKADQSRQVTLSYFVILLAWTLCVFIILAELFGILDFIRGWKAYLISFLVSLLIALSGGIMGIANLLEEFSNSFLILAKYGILKMIATIIVILFIAVLFTNLSNFVRKRYALEKASNLGSRLARGAKAADNLAEFNRKVASRK